MKFNKEDLSRSKVLPLELRAVIEILSADSELMAKALLHVNIEAQEVNWHKIARNHFGSGHSAAIMWAKSIWTNKQPSELDVFERSTSMDLHIRSAIIRALAMAWGLI